MTRAMREELEARVEAMEETGDVPPSERERTALEDIESLTADSHCVDHTPSEIRSWNRLRVEARALLAAMPEQPEVENPCRKCGCELAPHATKDICRACWEDERKDDDDVWHQW